MRKLLEAAPVDVAYLIHFLRWISPSVLPELSRRGIPVAVFVADFEYLCPGTHLLREGEVCELCLRGALRHSVRYRCVQGSLPMSAGHFLALKLYRLTKVLDLVDAFVCPSRFTAKKMEEGGFPKEKLFYIPAPVDARRIAPAFSEGRFIFYAGRISREKGVDVLLDAYAAYRRRLGKAALPLRLAQVGGDGLPELKRRLASGSLPGVTVVGPLYGESYFEQMRASAFTVVPSLCYDNSPNVIFESYACGKPVVGSRRGSIAELVRDGRTGLVFEPGDAEDLSEKLERLTEKPAQRAEMGRAARELAEKEFDASVVCEKLTGLFSTLRG